MLLHRPGQVETDDAAVCDPTAADCSDHLAIRVWQLLFMSQHQWQWHRHFWPSLYPMKSSEVIHTPRFYSQGTTRKTRGCLLCNIVKRTIWWDEASIVNFFQRVHCQIYSLSAMNALQDDIVVVINLLVGARIAQPKQDAESHSMWSGYTNCMMSSESVTMPSMSRETSGPAPSPIVSRVPNALTLCQPSIMIIIS